MSVQHNLSKANDNLVKSVFRSHCVARYVTSNTRNTIREWLMGGLLVGLIFSQDAMATQYPTSFNCTTATTATEQAICHDPQLANLDLQVSQTYSELIDDMKKSGDPKKHLNYLLTSQEKWKNEKIQCKGDSFCITDTYGKRLAELGACDL